MVNSRLCETAVKTSVFSASPRRFELLDCEAEFETPKRLSEKYKN